MCFCLMSRREVSERTAQLVDEEVSRVINESYQKAKVVLTEHRELLDVVAAALLDRETLGREDIRLLVEGSQLPPRLPPETSSPLLVPASAPAASKAAPPLLGGPEVAPA